MSEEAINMTGVVSGLAAASCWALSGLLYTRVPLNACAMVTYKNCLGALVMISVLMIRRAATGTAMFEASAEKWLYLSLSGVFGLSIADNAYFRSMQILGAQKGMTLTLLTPILTAVLGMLYLNERLTLAQVSWILLTLAGIAVVMRDQSEKTPEQNIRPGSAPWGVVCGIFGVAAVAIGSVQQKAGTDGVDSVEGACIRLIAAAASGIVFTIVMRETRDLYTFVRERTGVVTLSAGCLLGTVLGVWLMLVSFKYCSSATASTLTSTSPLFVMLFAAIIFRRRVSLLAVTGAFVAVAGVCLLLMH